MMQISSTFLYAQVLWFLILNYCAFFRLFCKFEKDVGKSERIYLKKSTINNMKLKKFINMLLTLMHKTCLFKWCNFKFFFVRGKKKLNLQFFTFINTTQKDASLTMLAANKSQIYHKWNTLSSEIVERLVFLHLISKESTYKITIAFNVLTNILISKVSLFQTAKTFENKKL